MRTPEDGVPVLQTQLESLLHCVWTAEQQWRWDDRIALAVRLQQLRSTPSSHTDVEPQR